MLAIAIAFALAWTGLVLTQNNLEMQSIDLCHHVMFVAHLGSPLATADPAHVGQYPLLSHRLATLLLPLYHNPIQAVRAVALASLLVMLVCQWHLLRTQLPAGLAMATLFAWQALCTSCKLGDANHFMWDFQFNYSRAVSGAALWLMLVSFAVPSAKWRGVNLAFAVGLATFAFRCHIAAGSLALATLGVWCCVNVIRKDWLTGLGGLGALAAAAAMLIFGTEEWRYLVSHAAEGGHMPIRHPDLIAMWMPTAVVGAIVAISRAATTIPLDLKTITLCGLIPTSLLQAYMLYCKNVTQTIGAYPYNQMLFYTFGLTTLYWFATIAPQLKKYFGGSCCNIAGAIAAGMGLYFLLECDARRPAMPRLQDPLQVANDLQKYHEAFQSHYYYDPQFEHASYLATRLVLEAQLPLAARYRDHIHWSRLKDLYSEPQLKGLFLLDGVDLIKHFGPEHGAETVGRFWRVDLVKYRQSGALARLREGVR
jgi:hypothetical protein